MVDLRYLADLFAIAKLNDVKCMNMQGLHIEFHGEQVEVQTKPHLIEPDSTQVIADALKKQEEAMPADLRADALMDQDKILHWSSPDNQGEEQDMPLTMASDL